MTEAPRTVVGVRFRNAGKIFYFDAAGLQVEVGEYVVVATARGPELARVVIAPDQIVVNELGEEASQPVLRLATEEDIRRAEELHRRAQEVVREARELAEEVGFEGHIDAAEFTLDGARLTLSYSSEGRVDHRELARAAAERFGVRVELKQLGARDRAKIVGGYGICGRELCCASWLATFPSISIRMAKNQELPLAPEKISGLCGRLLCCLSYEDETYQEMRKSLPKVGQRCSTPTGEGKVVAVNVLKREVTLSIHGETVTVGDKDLGLIVRWDPSSKSAPPPPPLTPEEAVAQGLIATPEEYPRWGEARRAAAVEGIGRLPRPAVRAAVIEEPPAFEPSPEALAVLKKEQERPRQRRFVRQTEEERPAAQQRAQAPGEGKRARRRGGRRRRRKK